MNEAREFVEALRAWRGRHGHKQEGAATMLGCTQSSLSRWERGRAQPPKEKRAQIMTVVADRWGSDADQFLAAIRHADNQMLVVAEDGRIQAASKGVVEAFGSQLVEGLHLFELCSEMDLQRFDRFGGLAKFMLSGEVMTFVGLTALAPAPKKITCVSTNVRGRNLILVTCEKIEHPDAVNDA
ncbi:MAG: transcriptional regulator [Proteobacteria bacterium]|nr:transcriptional regulator [Pseudomonadota bacterium]